jgi:hypothetical protein
VPLLLGCVQSAGWDRHLLYSVGPNLKDDGGQKERPGGDDVVLKIER